jgi:hypothetical protein
MRKMKPKKLRGDASRAERFRQRALAASQESDEQSQFLSRVISVLVERVGGRADVTFREIAAAAPLEFDCVDRGTIEAVLKMTTRRAAPVETPVGES